MTLQMIRPRSLAEQVFGQLVSEILGGRYASGALLPPERSLAEIFHVNRQVVREATKRLAQVGLVKISQGDGTRVLDFRDSAGLDLLGLMSEHASGALEVASYWRSLMEMRSAISVDLIRLCSARADRALKQQLFDLASAMQSCQAQPDLLDMQLRFWDLVQDGADNIAYRLSFNSMRMSALSVPERALAWTLFELECCEYHVPVAKAMLDGDPGQAVARARTDLRAALARYTGATEAANE